MQIRRRKGDAPVETQDPAVATGERDDVAAPNTELPRRRLFELRSDLTNSQRIGLGTLSVVAFFGIWQVLTMVAPEETGRFFPSPVDVVSALYALLTQQSFLQDVYISVRRITLSFLAASLVALPLGVLMGIFATVKGLFNPLVSAWRYLPAPSFIPLLLIWLGPGDLQKMALLFIGVVFFLIITIVDDTESVPHELVEASLTMGATRSQVLKTVVLPAAAPRIMDSMRAMIAVSWTYVFIAEIVGADTGIGAVMMRAGRFLHTDIIMAGILTIGVLGVLTDAAARFLRNLLFPWYSARKTG